MALLCIWLFCVTLYAAADSASESLKTILTKAIDIKTRTDLQGAEQQTMRARLVRELIAENFLSAEMARDSVKDYWDNLSQEQRQEFASLFIDLFQDSYTRLVLNYLRQETIEYRGEQPERQGVRLQTKLVRINEHIPVDYYLVQKDGRWFIQDVVIDGVSIVGNYQNQFRRVILTQSFDELVKKMRLQSQALRDNSAS
jgi:phospholipid transport system substrate-binding protein